MWHRTGTAWCRRRNQLILRIATYNLREGGEDRIGNAASLCPSHHREVHYGIQRSVLEAQLKELRAAGSDEWSRRDALT